MIPIIVSKAKVASEWWVPGYNKVQLLESRHALIFFSLLSSQIFGFRKLLGRTVLADAVFSDHSALFLRHIDRVWL